MTCSAITCLLALQLALISAHVGAEDRILEDSLDSLDAWKLSAIRPAVLAPEGGVMIQGTLDRNNPLRRELAQPFRGAELFVRFQFRYDPPEDEGEFFVMWLDRLDGGDRAVHAENVPNIGVHVADTGPKKGKTVFIVRIGSAKTAWSTVEMQRGRTYSVVGRLSKSEPEERADFDRFDLWVDPKADELDKPDATIKHPQSVNFVRWIGFGTGRKTERSDKLYVDDLVLSRTWQDVLKRSAAPPIAQAAPKPPSAPDFVWKEKVDFVQHVYPLLKTRCFKCHEGAKSKSGYRLDVRNEILGYSTGDPLAEPGKALESKIIEHVRSTTPEERMPPVEGGGEALTEKEIGLLWAWIDQGIAWDEKLLPSPNATSDHWAFQPVGKTNVPAVKREGWIRTPVDAFIAAKQEAKGIQPAAEASPRTLVRRLYLDLLGLPPKPEQVEAFVSDQSPDAYKHLVDQLLDSPHYGERWARYWLDLARWGESHGHQHDIPRPYAWRFRDYVIDSFNRDKPYDRFITEQLAGDELKPYSDEKLIATGFLGAARISGNDMNKAVQRNDVLVDIVNATGSAVMGLTMECAQCHNHKFDPLSQRDYYRLQAFFVNGQLGNLTLRDAATPNPTDLENWISGGAYKFYKSEADKLVKKKTFAHTTEPHTWGFHAPATSDPGIKRLPVVNRDPIPWDAEDLKTTRAHLLIRGDVARPGPELTSGWPEVLGRTPDSSKGLTRSDLAKWLTDRENPLVSRVWVNRLWQYHFGKGIVPTPSDFGTQGSPPSHPKLLDWLAAELMQNGWSTKHIHRQIVLSATYRQERKHNDANAAVDPENTLLWNWPRRRLEGEAIRDAVLVATGELDRTRGGPSVTPEREEKALRRTLYLYQRRSEMPDVMQMFDAPELIASCPQRGVSTVALQPLYLLNSDFMMRRAEALADKVYLFAGDDAAKQVETAFLRTLGRKPDTNEQQHAIAMLHTNADSHTTLVQFCHALINLNEFIYIP
ncbi:PSD1 and planctomycete cytochrome C domain-containing protein [Prosthecobacter sp.]|uniref:PSD1 and planctomycete cytochrome C domain-containing protein n=1 Tax=Prosthecobacter sp. TaxID=1965333 RepID=UPI0025F45320|nr:PSD1 and planctomycete cytochrome C domain-containing protein [Prosthecobacter sp.]